MAKDKHVSCPTTYSQEFWRSCAYRDDRLVKISLDKWAGYEYRKWSNYTIAINDDIYREVYPILSLHRAHCLYAISLLLHHSCIEDTMYNFEYMQNTKLSFFLPEVSGLGIDDYLTSCIIIPAFKVEKYPEYDKYSLLINNYPMLDIDYDLQKYKGLMVQRMLPDIT